MADLDSDTLDYLSGIYEELTKAGFKGKQTPGIPYHISLSTYSPFWPTREISALELKG